MAPAQGQAHHHRASLKQSNKKFKSRHATKSSLKEVSKGKVQRQSVKTTAGQSTAAQLRLNRRHAAKQAQTHKRTHLISALRLFSGSDGTPRVVSVVPLCPDVNARESARAIVRALDPDADVDGAPETGLWRVKADRFKTSLQFVLLPYRQLYAALDAAKTSDYTVLVLSPSTEVDNWGDLLLRCLQAQGLPSVVSVVAPEVPVPAKDRAGVLKSLLSFVRYFAPTQQRVYALDNTSDATNAARALCEGLPADVRWRDGRAWLLAENVRRTEEGELAITGYVRGASLSADRLVHLPGYGDFQISKIVSAALLRRGATGMDVEPTTLGMRTDDADSLVSTNEPDDLANEQTWPTEDEMRGAPGADATEDGVPDAAVGTTPRRIKRVPKGTSEYQAAWIIDADDDDEDYSGSERDDADNDAMEDEEMEDLPMDADDAASASEDEGPTRQVAFADLPVDEERAQLQTWRSRARAEADDAQFPDELDTPQDVPARTRFARFRGLRSLRTSPWDPYENLPRDYARIFQFEDFKRAERAVLRDIDGEDEGWVMQGTRVEVVLEDVPEEVRPEEVSAVFALFRHEHKVSVQHFAVTRNTEYGGTVRSKDPLVLCVGPRRFATRPVYSQHTRGGGKGVNNVHKFERFLHPGGGTAVATTFAPVTFGAGRMPCMLLRESSSDDQEPKLVAMGTLLPPDPTRILAKRIVLTGHPYRVHKKTATIRYMFFDPLDVAFFAPVQLHTKHGRVGHIRESLGTHGYFKAHFDGAIGQMDTVCLSLYKRVFPRWAEVWRPGMGLAVEGGGGHEDEEMEE